MDFQEKYKNLTNKIGTFRTETIVFWALDKLHYKERVHFTENMSLLPWELLSLIKLAFLYGDQKYPPKAATENDMRSLVNRLKDVSSKSPILEEGGPYKLQKYMRAVAHQQFWFQNSFSTSKLGKQLQLFQLLPCQYDIAGKFKEFTEIEIETFFELAMVVFTFLVNEPSRVEFNAGEIAKGYPNQHVHAFFNLLSLEWHKVKEKLQSSDFNKVKSQELQFLEQTPFVKYPFIQLPDGKYLLVSRKVFEETISNYAYDLFKSREPNEFAQEFGKLTFESYLDLGLKFSGQTYMNELELKTIIGKASKAVDFTVFCDDCTVLVECKAIEMRPYARTFPVNNVLSKEFESSILKALKQLYTVAKLLKSNQQQEGHPIHPEIFGLVVTYKELYLGPGGIAWQEFLAEDMQDFLDHENISLQTLPPENIFYISIECFDFLIATLKHSKYTLGEILRKAVSNNKSVGTRKFLLDQYLTSEFPVDSYSLPYLVKAQENLFNKITNFLGFGDFTEE